ncbi:acyl-CoA/acyl-ACP dehydrogenase [Rhodococcus pseudokoreensis]|uniref:Acyl-CoA/acyl-ACP dehydrogenase n=1 Tax=Rhodococcus pseudokoreensis TaxID=2811421 RepID=A0A974ZZ41_9NOCA|nr:acyl-CoA/acyl-ACP dehydrogenase [Rhodococcus pseudokoreensis]
MFEFSSEQEDFRAALRRFLSAKSGPAEARRLIGDPSGYDSGVWAQMAGELGLHGLHIPEEFGGAGCGWVELLVASEEMGRSLLSAPFFATVALGATALMESGDETAQRTHLPSIADGSTVVTLALAEPTGSWVPGDVRASAVESGGEWRLHGEKCFVVDGMAADLILVAARTRRGVSLFACDGAAPGLVRKPQEALDSTRRLAGVMLSDTPAVLVGEEGAAEPVLQRVLDLAAVALAAEQVGGAQQCLDMSVEYAKVRHQFGRAIGSFQAIKHMCADALLEVESARSAAYRAAWDAATGADEFPAHASMAKALCSDAFVATAAMTIQVHGGVGFTWEHDAHLYFKRAKSSEFFLGSPARHRERFLSLIGLPSELAAPVDQPHQASRVA